MIRQEYLEGGLVRTWSDAGMYIHGGYPEADREESIDPVSMGRVFVETDRPIEDWEEPESMVSSKNIETNRYFTVGGTLYFSTATIAVGDDIVPGVNCTEMEVSDALNDLKEED